MGFEQTKAALTASPKTWTVTGAAGFIGSNLVESLLRLDQNVIGLDNLSTGKSANLDEVRAAVGAARWKRFTWMEGDICEPAACRKAVAEADYVLHQAALGSVPRSIANPAETNAINVSGFINVLEAARESGVKRIVYASSSSVYGDAQTLPQVEEKIGNCLSPYAVSKRANELYAGVFASCYGVESVGLRYFNVFGPRQDPNGPYAAVIPRWIAAMIQNQPAFINGDGSTSRDFCHVANVVQANLLAATTTNAAAVNTIYNISAGGETTLAELFELLRERLLPAWPHLRQFEAERRPFQPGDVRHSRADISKARRLLDYAPSHAIEAGLDEALPWYTAAFGASKAAGKPESIIAV